MSPKTQAHIKIAAMVTATLVIMAVCWVAGCAKKSRREAVSETRDTLTVTSNTLSKIHDTLSEIPIMLTDTRDGKTYKTVTIGKQTWMAENLNYATESGSWCYGDDSSNCNTYGRLYDWNTAMNGASSSSANPSKVQGVCPSGWHLPSREEWNTLENYAGGSSAAGNKLKSTSGWYDDGNGTDDYGFSALPGGFRSSGGSFSNVGYFGNWWTATEDNSGRAYSRNMNYRYGNLVEDYEYGKEYGFAVRCVGDRSAAR